MAKAAETPTRIKFWQRLRSGRRRARPPEIAILKMFFFFVPPADLDLPKPPMRPKFLAAEDWREGEGAATAKGLSRSALSFQPPSNFFSSSSFSFALTLFLLFFFFLSPSFFRMEMANRKTFEPLLSPPPSLFITA